MKNLNQENTENRNASPNPAQSGWKDLVRPMPGSPDDKSGGRSDKPVASHGRTRAVGISPETDEILERIDTATIRKKTMRGRAFASNLLIFGGILLIVVPLIMTAISMKRNSDAMNDFIQDTSGIVDDAQASVENVDEFYSESVDFEAVSVQEGAVDPSVTAGDPSTGVAAGITDSAISGSAVDAAPVETASAAAAEPTKKPLMTKEEIQKRMIGVLYIDKIDVRMPVMTGVDDETLRVAAGRMPESGKLDKIGNVVLAGHRSYTFGKYFNRLDEMKVNDTFTIKTGKKTLEYKVFKVFIVEPDDFSILNYNKTDKICTLFTCHPVVIANKRLVVQGIQTN